MSVECGVWSVECEMIFEKFDAFVVDFDGFEFALFLREKLRENAHSRADFEDGNVGTGIDGVGDAAGDVEVAEEVLTEVFLGFHQFHAAKLRLNEQNAKEKQFSFCISLVFS